MESDVELETLEVPQPQNVTIISKKRINETVFFIVSLLHEICIEQNVKIWEIHYCISQIDTMIKRLALQSLFDSNSHGNGHADHGVVTCAQEAHHLNVKSACRRLFACGAGTFGGGSPTFHKIRSTSQESSMLCFPSMGTSYHIMCSRNKVF